MAQALLEYETLTGDEIRRVLLGEKLDREDDSPQPPKPPTPALPVIDEDGDGIPDRPRGWGRAGAAPGLKAQRFLTSARCRQTLGRCKFTCWLTLSPF
jgi:hypothetical protein